MWNEVRIIAKMMKPGEYWYLNNVQAKWDLHHYMEGKMNFVEKVKQLVVDNLEAQPHLVTLLETMSFIYCYDVLTLVQEKTQTWIGSKPYVYFSEDAP